MKEDEKKFFKEFCERYEKSTHKEIVFGMLVDAHDTPRQMINEEGFPMHRKRAWYLLDKWASKGWYDYGVTLDLGWPTPIGIEISKTL